MDRRLKTLVVIDNLHTGGVATSLYNYLKYTCQYLDCDLLVFNEDSVDYNRLPQGVNILKPQRILHILGKNQQEMKKESFFLALLRGMLFLFSRIFNGVAARNLLLPFVKKIGEYDYSVAYAQDDGWKSLSKGCIDFVVKKVNSRRKAVVVHCDYKNFGGYHPRQINTFKCLDFIICVSKSCRMSFLDCFPSLCDSTIVCENFTDIDTIKNQAGLGETGDNTCVNFVTVCRISKVKGLERVVTALKKIVDEGYTGLRWVIVGDGPEKNTLYERINELGLNSFVSFAGERLNPYPFIKEADWFVLPSYHEAAPMVYGESVALKVPVLSTETCSAKELIEDRGWGIVVDNSEQGLYDGLKDIISRRKRDFVIKVSNVNEFAIAQFDSFIKRITD